MRPLARRFLALAVACASATPAAGATLYDNLTPDGALAAATRQDAPRAFEIETADDFLLTSRVHVTSATFTGIIVPGGSGAPAISAVAAEVYHVYPVDSDTTRTPAVPTRANSPSDVAMAGRASDAGEVSFSSTLLNPAFSASNSVAPGGIHPPPGQTTGGDGPRSGMEVVVTASFATPFDLAPGHYFFAPQVTVADGGQFYWLAAARPIAGAGTTPITPDLQAWTRDAGLNPDWLRIGTDIIGGTPPPQFNMAFALHGDVVPLPPSRQLMLEGFAIVACAGLGRRRPASARCQVEGTIARRRGAGRHTA